MSTGTWNDVVKWAKGEVEAARTKLETTTDPVEAATLRARCLVMRELQTITETPKPPAIPEPVSY